VATDVVPSDMTGETSIGNTLIGTLRKAYGVHFAEGCGDDEKLRDVLYKMDGSSLSTLLHDHRHGKLEQICRQAV
jgi:hypothetical protein